MSKHKLQQASKTEAQEVYRTGQRVCILYKLAEVGFLDGSLGVSNESEASNGSGNGTHGPGVEALALLSHEIAISRVGFTVDALVGCSSLVNDGSTVLKRDDGFEGILHLNSANNNTGNVATLVRGSVGKLISSLLFDVHGTRFGGSKGTINVVGANSASFDVRERSFHGDGSSTLEFTLRLSSVLDVNDARQLSCRRLPRGRLYAIESDCIGADLSKVNRATESDLVRNVTPDCIKAFSTSVLVQIVEAGFDGDSCAALETKNRS